MISDLACENCEAVLLFVSNWTPFPGHLLALRNPALLPQGGDKIALYRLLCARCHAVVGIGAKLLKFKF